MYDWPDVYAHNDAIWDFVRAQLADQGIPAPEKLDRGLRYSQPWRRPDLLLAQTCGFPFATELRGQVQLVATPCYSAPGCEGTNYSSMIIASRASGITSLEDLGGATASINSEHSQSGHWALREALALTPGAALPKRAVLSGGHLKSLTLLANGDADVAAIDAVCWALALRYEPSAVAKVRVIAQSPMAPGLPLITSLATPVSTLEALREALQAVIAAPHLAGAREALFLTAIEVLPETAYERILDLKRLADAMPFPALGA